MSVIRAYISIYPPAEHLEEGNPPGDVWRSLEQPGGRGGGGRDPARHTVNLREEHGEKLAKVRIVIK